MSKTEWPEDIPLKEPEMFRLSSRIAPFVHASRYKAAAGKATGEQNLGDLHEIHAEIRRRWSAHPRIVEALRWAISQLPQRPCDDCRSRDRERYESCRELGGYDARLKDGNCEHAAATLLLRNEEPAHD